MPSGTVITVSRPERPGEASRRSRCSRCLPACDTASTRWSNRSARCATSTARTAITCTSRICCSNRASPELAEGMLERHIRQYIRRRRRADEVVFSWQGGEPTILGIEFFRQVVALQARYRKPGQRIENDLQTNGTLLDEEWAAFLKQNNFLVGLSCDGPKELHDRYRYTKGGTHTTPRSSRAARLLQKHDIPLRCAVRGESRQCEASAGRLSLPDP